MQYLNSQSVNASQGSAPTAATATGYEDPLIFLDLPTKSKTQPLQQGNQGAAGNAKEEEEERENDVVISQRDRIFDTKLFQRLVSPQLPESICDSTLVKFGQMEVDCLDILGVGLHSPADLLV